MTKTSTMTCNPKPAIEQRDLLDGWDAERLEVTFKLLANSTRLRILHALVRQPGLCVSDIADQLSMKTQAISNQLQKLADNGIVEASRAGLKMHYRIVDTCVVTLLDRGWCLTEDAEPMKNKEAS